MVVLPDAGIAARLDHDLLVQGVIVRPLAAFGLPIAFVIDRIGRG